MVLMTSTYRVGQLVSAESWFQRGLAHFEHPAFKQRPSVIAQTFGNAARIAWLLGDDAAADDRIRHAQSVAHSNNHPFDEAYADYMAAVHFALVEQFEASRSFAQNSVALSDKFGFPQFAGIARIPLGRALAGLGDHQQGLALIADGLDRMDATSVRVARTMYLTWQADLCLQAGLVDQAMRSADDALSFNPSEAFYRPETLRVRANVLHVIGHTEAAAAARAAARALAIQLQATRLLQHLDRNP